MSEFEAASPSYFTPMERAYGAVISKVLGGPQSWCGHTNEDFSRNQIPVDQLPSLVSI